MDKNKIADAVSDAEAAAMRGEWDLLREIIERFDREAIGSLTQLDEDPMADARRSYRLRNRVRFVACRRGALGRIWHTPMPSERAACVAAARMCERHGSAVVIEIPPGEGDDFDGTIVFECRRGRLR